ncbi:MAG: hypothetical protein F6K42_12430 [Leptolyngbya sp. SIO1D8]|nr:hypothetical protein [Leptolyngbya sp. SIO1D8]
MEVIKGILNKRKIPIPELEYRELKNEHTYGYFSPRQWKIRINSKACPPQLNKKALPTLMNALYHETRHCEQFYLSARYLAMSFNGSNEKKVNDIVNELDIKRDIAEEAIKHPYESRASVRKSKRSKISKKNILAELDTVNKWQALFRRLRGTKADNQRLITEEENEVATVEANLNEARKFLEEYENLSDEDKNKRKGEYEKYKKQRDENHKKYREWLHEADAWDVGSKVGDSYTDQAVRHLLSVFSKAKIGPERALLSSLLNKSKITTNTIKNGKNIPWRIKRETRISFARFQ